jgi:hypothetical protein
MLGIADVFHPQFPAEPVPSGVCDRNVDFDGFAGAGPRFSCFPERAHSGRMVMKSVPDRQCGCREHNALRCLRKRSMLKNESKGIGA